VNHKKNADVKCPQTMRCILCYNSLVWFCNLKTQAKKNLIIYKFITNEIITLQEHVNANHFIIAKMFERKQIIHKEEKWRNNLPKKKSNPFGSVIVNCFATKNLCKKIICNKKMFLEDMGLLMLKIICPCNLLKVCR
jgi:Cu2+-containing amine oxidase